MNDILDFSKIEEGKLVLDKAPVDLQLLLTTMQQLIAPSLREKGLRFSFNIHTQVPRYGAGDALRLKQILLNLLSNAIKFTPHGSITLHVDYIPTYDVGTSDGEGVFSFVVEDTGIGLSPEQQAKIFQQFEQADTSTTRKYGGSGLGLSISKSLAVMMGGDLGVLSEAGQGSKFWVMVPLPLDSSKDPGVFVSLTQNLPTIKETIPSSTPTPSFISTTAASAEIKPTSAFALQLENSPRILVVEDNHVNQRVASRLLEKLGARVTVASNGSEALMLLSQERMDLVLMDCQMPVMDGYETTRTIRQLAMDETETPTEVPIIALTGNVIPEEMAKCLQSGMNDVITKPVQLAILQEKVSYWLNSQLGQGPGPQQVPGPQSSKAVG